MDAMSNLDQVVIFIEVDKYKTKQNKISIKQNKTKQNIRTLSQVAQIPMISLCIVYAGVGPDYLDH